MQISELQRDLQNGGSNDSIVIVSEENIYNIKDINAVEGSIIITIEPVVDFNRNSSITDGIRISDGGNSSTDIGMLDTFGNLSNISNRI